MIRRKKLMEVNAATRRVIRLRRGDCRYAAGEDADGIFTSITRHEAPITPCEAGITSISFKGVRVAHSGSDGDGVGAGHRARLALLSRCARLYGAGRAGR